MDQTTSRDRRITIRPLREEDITELYRIHQKFYENNFKFPDLNQFYNLFIVEQYGEIITAGGIRPIAEFIAITNKDISTRNRFEGLSRLLGMQIYECRRQGLDSIHCFVENEQWIRVLQKSGFQDTKGRALVLIL